MPVANRSNGRYKSPLFADEVDAFVQRYEGVR